MLYDYLVWNSNSYYTNLPRMNTTKYIKCLNSNHQTVLVYYFIHFHFQSIRILAQLLFLLSHTCILPLWGSQYYQLYYIIVLLLKYSKIDETPYNAIRRRVLTPKDCGRISTRIDVSTSSYIKSDRALHSIIIYYYRRTADIIIILCLSAEHRSLGGNSTEGASPRNPIYQTPTT